MPHYNPNSLINSIQDIEKVKKGYNSLKQFYGEKSIEKLIIATTRKESHKVGKDIHIESGWFWE